MVSFHANVAPIEVRIMIYAYKHAHDTMHMNNVTSAPVKRATNLSLSGDVLDAARELGLNLSQLCDAYLRERVRREQACRWRTEHADFVANYNDTLENEGLPLDEWRKF